MDNSPAFCNPEDFDSIDQIETTSETLTSRAGMALFSRYLRNLGLLSELGRLFGSLRSSKKGLPIPVLFHQIICFFLDGTRFSLVRFDELKEEDGYAGAIEVRPESMASSHQIKRFSRQWSGHALRILSGANLVVSVPNPEGISLAALANVFACPES